MCGHYNSRLISVWVRPELSKKCGEMDLNFTASRLISELITILMERHLGIVIVLSKMPLHPIASNQNIKKYSIEGADNKMETIPYLSMEMLICLQLCCILLLHCKNELNKVQKSCTEVTTYLK